MTLRTYTLIIITIVLCLLAWFIAKGESPPHTNPGHAYIVPGKIGLEWLFHDESRVWIEAKSADQKGWTNDGWHPNWTVLISQYKPIMTQRSDGKYEITFTQGKVDMP